MVHSVHPPRPAPLRRLGLHLRKNGWFYVFLLPAAIYVFVFDYLTIYGLVIAFMDFSFARGFALSKWVGLKHFEILFESPTFYRVLKNSLTLSFMRLAVGFPMPIALALLLNEVRHLGFKRLSQTIVYLPHFISWVIIAGMTYNLFGTTDGMVNVFLRQLGLKNVPFLSSPGLFRQTLIGIEIWKGLGWGSIVYLSAITTIDPEYYEAARVDGAGRWKCMRYITLPCIAPTLTVMLILRMGSLINNGFEQIYLLYSPLVYEVADVLETYAYRVGIREGRYSYTTALGLFKSLISVVMVFGTNAFSRKISGNAIF